MQAFYLALALGGTTMMCMFAAAYAAKFEALGRIDTLAAARHVVERDVF